MLSTLIQFRRSLCSWRFWLALTVLLGLLVTTPLAALYGWPDPYEIGKALAPIELALLALLYALGFFVFLPESVGADASPAGTPLLERWSNFVGIVLLLELLLLATLYFLVIHENYSYICFAVAVPVIFFCASLVPAWIAACSLDLGWARLSIDAHPTAGFWPPVRSGLFAWGRWPVSHLGARSSLVLGAVLLFTSLPLDVKGQIFLSQTGLEVLKAQMSLPTFLQLSVINRVDLLDSVFCIAYAASLLLGLLALVVALSPHVSSRLCRGWLPVTFAAVLSLGQIGNLLWPDEHFSWGALTRVALFATLPVLVWLVSSTGSATRLFMFMLFLPLSVFWIFPLTLRTYLAPGFGCLMFGLVLLWWGFLQRHRATQSAH